MHIISQNKVFIYVGAENTSTLGQISETWSYFTNIQRTIEANICSGGSFSVNMSPSTVKANPNSS